MYNFEPDQAVSLCREFTLNMISEWFLEAANHTCGSYDPEIDELALAGLTAVPSKRVRCTATIPLLPGTAPDANQLCYQGRDHEKVSR